MAFEKHDTQFLGDELESHENTASARFHFIACGLEKTVSYGSGTRHGAAAILAASQQLERRVEGVEGASEPCRQGFFTHKAIDCVPAIETVLVNLRMKIAEIVRGKHIPVTLGGEHSLTYGSVLGVRDALESADLGIIHIDAHADFRVAYQGHRHSHASVMYLLAQEGIPICSLGVRALSREEDAARRAHGVIAHDGGELVRKNIHEIVLPDDFPRNIYVSFDLDGLDSGFMAATGTPVPGGLGFYQAIDLVRSCFVGRRCVGLDVVELAPLPHLRECDFTAAMLTHALVGLI